MLESIGQATLAAMLKGENLRLQLPDGTDLPPLFPPTLKVEHGEPGHHIHSFSTMKVMYWLRDQALRDRLEARRDST